MKKASSIQSDDSRKKVEQPLHLEHPSSVSLQKSRVSGRLVNRLLKFLLLILLFGALYFDINGRDKLADVYQLFWTNLTQANFQWLLFAFLLMPINWLFECEKWLSPMRKYEPMTRIQAFKAVLAGVSFSLFTPNRIGEYGGRILFVRPENQWKAVFINILGNISQIIVLLTFGAVGFLWMFNRFFEPNSLIISSLLTAFVLGVPLLLFAFFNIDLIVPIAKRIPYLHHIKRFVKDIHVLRRFSNAELRTVLVLSTMRYLVYVVQYFLLLRFFGVELGLFQAFAGISTIFILQTSIPLPPIMGLLARGNIAIFIWSFFGANDLSVLAATFTLWIINLILPSFFGVYFIIRTNIAKSFGYDDDQA